jgi:glycosyltransferase involved in cell wall biosynthesis
MDVSVVVPTRNRSALLAMTLRSALAQQQVDFEIIVVDEASTDDTPAVIAGLGDPRIRVIRHSRAQGVSAARNQGVSEARAEWIAFLDDDDLWAPTKLALQLRAARQSGAAWVYVGHVNINVHYRVTGGEPPLAPPELIDQLPAHNVVPGGCSGVMASKNALQRAGLFDVEFQPLADWDLWLRLAHGGLPGWVPQPLVAYRLHGEQMSLDASRVETEFWRLAGHNPEANPAIFYRYLGWWALRVKDHRAALRHFMRAWRQRRPPSPSLTLAADLVTVARDLVEHRLRMRLPDMRRTRQTAREHASWRDAGQAWVDALIEANVAVSDPVSLDPSR